MQTILYSKTIFRIEKSVKKEDEECLCTKKKYEKKVERVFFCLVMNKIKKGTCYIARAAIERWDRYIPLHFCWRFVYTFPNGCACLYCLPCIPLQNCRPIHTHTHTIKESPFLFYIPYNFLFSFTWVVSPFLFFLLIWPTTLNLRWQSCLCGRSENTIVP